MRCLFSKCWPVCWPHEFRQQLHVPKLLLPFIAQFVLPLLRFQAVDLFKLTITNDQNWWSFKLAHFNYLDPLQSKISTATAIIVNVPIRASFLCYVRLTKASTLQGTNISHLGKRKIIFKHALGGDMLVPSLKDLHCGESLLLLDLGNVWKVTDSLANDSSWAILEFNCQCILKYHHKKNSSQFNVTR